MPSTHCCLPGRSETPRKARVTLGRTPITRLDSPDMAAPRWRTSFIENCDFIVRHCERLSSNLITHEHWCRTDTAHMPAAALLAQCCARQRNVSGEDGAPQVFQIDSAETSRESAQRPGSSAYNGSARVPAPRWRAGKVAVCSTGLSGYPRLLRPPLSHGVPRTVSLPGTSQKRGSTWGFSTSDHRVPPAARR